MNQAELQALADELRKSGMRPGAKGWAGGLARGIQGAWGGIAQGQANRSLDDLRKSKQGIIDAQKKAQDQQAFQSYMQNPPAAPPAAPVDYSQFDEQRLRELGIL